MTLPIVLADVTTLPERDAVRLVAAACALEGEHRTWIADGPLRPELASLCGRSVS